MKDQNTIDDNDFKGDEKEISNLINEYIKPAVESDGGSITLDSFDDGVVTVNIPENHPNTQKNSWNAHAFTAIKATDSSVNFADFDKIYNNSIKKE